MNDESTRLLIDENENIMNQPVAPAPEAAGAPQEYPQPQATPKATRQGVGAGVVAAAAGLAAAAGAAVGTVTPYVVAAALLDDESVETTDDNTEPTPTGPTTIEGIQVAHVNANSFSEAFAQARAQVGPGGVFEYEGRVYGTYYANEWNAMSPAEQAAFTRQAMAANAAGHAGHDGASEATEVTAVADDAETTSEAADGSDKSIIAEVDDSDVRIIGVEDIPLDNGDLATAIITTIDDTPVAFVDLDNDSLVDVAVVIPSDEVLPVDDGKGGPAEIFMDDPQVSVSPTDTYFNDFDFIDTDFM